MAEPDGRFINFRSYGTSGHLAQLANGSFLTVWTEFDEQGGAYVYGMAFKADGTTLKDVFLIEYASSALFSDVTATTLSDGRTVVAWTKSAGATSVVAKVLNADLSSTGTLLEMSLGINSAGTPQVHALDVTDDQGQQYIGFAATYQGSYNISTTEDFTGTIVHAVVETAPDVWGSIDYQGLHRLPDSSSSTAVLGDRTYVLAVSMPDTKSLRFYRQGVGDADWSEFDVGQELTGTHPIVSSIGANKFVVAWERNDGSQIQAQVFGTDGKPEAGLFSFEKPTGTLIGAPVIKQLASGGFAVALRVDVGNGDDNVYTAAVDAQGNSIIALTAVGKITTGDQWDPSITILSGDKYAVSWQRQLPRPCFCTEVQADTV
jgi:hypothetical protein